MTSLRPEGREGSTIVDVRSLILARRSVRSGFSSEPIEAAIIEEIVQAGLSAPSSKNSQPWKLHIVHDREILRQIAREIVSAKTDGRYVPQDPRTGKPREEFVDTVDESAHVLGNVALGIFLEDSGPFSVSRDVVAGAADSARVGAVFGYGLEYIGLGACIENMWLTALSYGIEGVFMGDAAIAEDSIKERLEMVGDFVGVLALGYTVQPPPEPFPKRFKDERVVWH